MNWQPRLVALDIDGTLVDRSGRLPQQVRAAVRRVVDSGTPVVLATGRSWQDAVPIFDELELPPAPIVTSNGSVIVDYPPMRVRNRVTFDPEPTVRRVLDLAPNACIAVEDLDGFRMNKAFPQGDLTGNLSVVSQADLVSQPVTRIIVRDPNAREQDFVRLAERIGMHGVSYSVGWSAWLDIAPTGVNKASGLAWVCGEYGLNSADVLAIGDGRNDIEMLHWVGRGVALGDAPWEVRTAADVVTANFEDGGTCHELDRWFLFGHRGFEVDAARSA